MVAGFGFATGFGWGMVRLVPSTEETGKKGKNPGLENSDSRKVDFEKVKISQLRFREVPGAFADSRGWAGLGAP